jgi:hypothetical protein
VIVIVQHEGVGVVNETEDSVEGGGENYKTRKMQVVDAYVCRKHESNAKYKMGCEVGFEVKEENKKHNWSIKLR